MYLKILSNISRFNYCKSSLQKKVREKKFGKKYFEKKIVKKHFEKKIVDKHFGKKLLIFGT